MHTNNLQKIDKQIKVKTHANIALIKYWGKKADQMPCNPSISFTLSNCYTQIEAYIEEKKNEKPRVNLIFEGKQYPAFEKKTRDYFQKITQHIPEVKLYDITLQSHNSFPHSSGIASSASAFAALAQIAAQLSTIPLSKNEISHYARLGSGSACRSTQNGWSLWGKHTGFAKSSDHYAIPYPKTIHKNFDAIQDSVIIVDSDEKVVSSSQGHRLIENHPFAKNRFKCAHQNLKKLSQSLESGDWETFGKIVETEALMLHAMMMTSNPYYILMAPDTLKIIKSVWTLRKEEKSPLFFTLDAGANIHLIYPYAYREKASSFIESFKRRVVYNEILT